MKRENFILIQGWMVNKLGLSGNDLICYALIYGFTQNGEYWEKSSSYISDWLGVSKRSVIDILKRLVDCGYLDKKEYEVNGVKFCKYKANVPNFIGGEESSPRGSEDSSPCINNNINNTLERKENTKRKESEASDKELFHQFEEFAKEYKRLCGKHTVSGIKTLYEEFKKRHKDWQEVIPMLMPALKLEDQARKNAIARREFYPQPKNLATYLGKQRAWEAWEEDISKYNSNEYHPQCDGVSLFWNENAKCYITPFDIESVADGYTKANRPNGAIVMWRGYKYVWSSNVKEWIKQ